MPTKKPFLTMCMIAKDEAHNIDRCFESWWAHVDEVVIVDTGSSDGTLGKALEFAKCKRQASKLKTATFKWVDDFSAARQAADDLATGDWITWCDLDDTVEGMETLREYAVQADKSVRGFFLRYDYARDPSGNSISELWRERVVRNDGNKWQGRLHEHKLFEFGMIVKVPPNVAQWVHHRDHTVRSGERNLRILEQWDKDEPDNPRIISSMALEYMGEERHKDAAEAFQRFLLLRGEPTDRRCQAFRHLCVMLLLQGRTAEAKDAAFQALREDWHWADTHLTLGEVAQTEGDPKLGLTHAEDAMRLGKPETLLIVNPLQYTAHPLALQAVCLAQMGRFDEAVKKADECLAIAPTYSLAADYAPMWRGALKKQLAVGAFQSLCDALVEVGELEKAQQLLSLAPFYAADEPALIQRRAVIAREVTQRLKSPPELEPDEAADAFIERMVAA